MKRRGKIALFTAGVATIVALYFFPTITDEVADRILANVLSPKDRELPPTVTNHRQGSEDIQIVGGLGAGLNCSLPPGVDRLAFPRSEGTSPISLRMRQACAFHDLCYRHGDATYGYTQADCDYLLQEQAFRLCTQISQSERGVAACETEARKVTLGVRLGGWGSYRRADHPDASYRAEDLPKASYRRPSVYYEFDPYPTRADQYVSLKIADAPADWVRAGMARKAYYAFRIRPSGTQLRIIGFDPKSGARRCAAYRIAADYRFIVTPPMVARVKGRDGAPDEDWFVWWRREDTTNTAGVFSGIAPARATEADWRKTFGAVENITNQAVCAGDRVTLAAGAEAAPAASFADLEPTPRTPGVNPDVIVSEFYPQPADQPSARAGVIALYGLTTHQCAKDVKDTSPCVREVLIDLKSPKAEHEPYRTLDPDCYRNEENKRNKIDCDRYRNFVGPPFVDGVGAQAGLAWMRRGDAVGRGYVNDALLTWAPASDPKVDPATKKRLPNYARFRLAGLKEKHEPAIWTRSGPDAAQALITVAPSPYKCGRGRELRLRRYAFAAVTAGARLPDPSSSMTARCLPGLHASWLERPWRLIGGRVLMFLRERVSVSKETDPDWTATRRLEIALADISDFDAISIRKLPLIEIQSFAVCDVEKQSETPWRVQNAPCGSPHQTSYGRARKRDDKNVDRNSARDAMYASIHAMPTAVGDMDGDGAPEIGFALPDFRDVIVLRPAGGSWPAEATWSRLDNPLRQAPAPKP